MRLLIILLFSVSSIHSLWGQEQCCVMFYNIENFFDTYNDPATLDDEFTPGGEKHWTKTRYMQKLRRIAEVIASVNEKDFPAIVGLAEVENRFVLKELCEKTVLADAGYQIVHQDSPDRRGIDVALLYRKDLFKPLNIDFLRPEFPEDTSFRTRDILYLSGCLQGDTLHFFVCHFPSMLGGERQSEWKRIRAAATLRTKVEALFTQNPQAKIIIMGDLNGKANTAAQKALGCHRPGKNMTTNTLYNTGYYLLKKDYGSYRYQGRWQTIDHIIVSGSLLNTSSGWYSSPKLTIYRADFLMEKDKAHFGYKPIPTYRGPRYIGGYSDHLPVYLELYRTTDAPHPDKIFFEEYPTTKSSKTFPGF